MASAAGPCTADQEPPDLCRYFRWIVEVAPATHDGSSVTCSRPEISMTSPFWTLKVTLDTAPRPGLLLRTTLTPSFVMMKVPLCPAPEVATYLPGPRSCPTVQVPA